MTSKSLSYIAGLGLVPGLGAFWFITHGTAGTASESLAIHIAGFYLLSFMMFAAYPARRRTDLIAMLLLGAIVFQAASKIASGGGDVLDLLGDAAGIFTLHASSHLEALRKRMREDPWLAAFASTAADRRRSGSILNMRAVGATRRTQASKCSDCL